MQESVDDPEPVVMLDDESEQDRFVELVATDSVTVPLKPLRGTTVMVEVAPAPTITVTLVGLALVMKS